MPLDERASIAAIAEACHGQFLTSLSDDIFAGHAYFLPCGCPRERSARRQPLANAATTADNAAMRFFRWRHRGEPYATMTAPPMSADVVDACRLILGMPALRRHDGMTPPRQAIAAMMPPPPGRGAAHRRVSRLMAEPPRRGATEQAPLRLRCWPMLRDAHGDASAADDSRLFITPPSRIGCRYFIWSDYECYALAADIYFRAFSCRRDAASAAKRQWRHAPARRLPSPDSRFQQASLPATTGPPTRI